MRLGPHVRTESGWTVVDDDPSDERIIDVGSNFMVGNGYLGYRGTRPDHRADAFVACVVSDTYDMADGVWRELCTVPNGLFVELAADAQPLRPDPRHRAEVELDVRTGEHRLRGRWATADGVSADVSVRRTASLDDLHLLVQEVTVAPTQGIELTITAGIDPVVWSLNGDHFASLERLDDAELPRGEVGMRAVTVEEGVEIVVGSRSTVHASTPTAAGEAAHGIVGSATRVRVDAGDQVTITTSMAVASSNDELDAMTPVDRVVASIAASTESGYAAVLERSANRWAEFWRNADVVIHGDLAAQAALRFSLWHNRIATPAHTDRLPIGARGLSCQAYQGAAFWDQEMFNLHAYLVTDPEVARRILVYRWRTLDGARRKAARLGYDGAYYAWISGTTGDELCPDFFFDDVLTGRPIRNHFNVWQMHVSPDIAFTVRRYWEVTGDDGFMIEHGAEILFEVARFLHSFVRLNEWRDRYEVIRLLGPDEWHENVDNDAYTNRLTQLSLTAAVETYEWMSFHAPDQLAELGRRIGVTHDDIVVWRRVLDRLYVPQPDPETGLIEQFDGFYGLADERPDDLRKRLLDPGEYWGWPNGVAVHTQVSKQPAVVQLFTVDPSWPLDVQRANYDYYEPRCAHGSSLSHSVHATVATRLGDIDSRYLDQAYDYFMQTATIDLNAEHTATVGGTFIGGMHTAANAGAYQTAVFGFGGLDVADGVVAISPHLPPQWTGLDYRVIAHGQGLSVRIDGSTTVVEADEANTAPIEVRFGRAQPIAVRPGEVSSG